MDPASAMALASASFATIKKGFAIGRDVESMMSDIGRWMGALSDLITEREAKNPPYLRNFLLANRSSRKLWKCSPPSERRKLKEMN